MVIDKDTGEVTINDAAGEQLGWFDYSFVVGWWIEREPNDLSNLSQKDLSAALKKQIAELPAADRTRLLESMPDVIDLVAEPDQT